MNPTAEQLRAGGWVEKAPDQWVRPKNLGAGGGVVADTPGERGTTTCVSASDKGEAARRPESALGQSGGTNAGNIVRMAEIVVSGISAPPARTIKRLRQSSKPLLNKLETEWYHVLKSSYPEGIPVFAQAIRFRLGNGIWYKPDFTVWGGLIYAYEVKGPHAFRGGFENLKVAANLYREIKWYLVWKQDNQWQEQEILA